MLAMSRQVDDGAMVIRWQVDGGAMAGAVHRTDGLVRLDWALGRAEGTAWFGVCNEPADHCLPAEGIGTIRRVEEQQATGLQDHAHQPRLRT